MKTLHFLRHAKSSWKLPLLADIDRPLSGRGNKACQLMANPILNTGCYFNNIFCSPAQRAKYTIENIALQLPKQNIHWKIDEQLYTFSGTVLMSWCQHLPESINSFMMIGHNPAISDICHELSNAQISHVPTCSYVQLTSTANTWAELSAKNTKLITMLTPKVVASKYLNKS